MLGLFLLGKVVQTPDAEKRNDVTGDVLEETGVY
jgi:hypothetical protein